MRTRVVINVSTNRTYSISPFGRYYIQTKLLGCPVREDSDDYCTHVYDVTEERHNPLLLKCVENLGAEHAGTVDVTLRIVEIDTPFYRIVTKDDGTERVVAMRERSHPQAVDARVFWTLPADAHSEDSDP